MDKRISLKLKKTKISRLGEFLENSIKGGTSQPKATNAMCNSVPAAEGGIGCHLF